MYDFRLAPGTKGLKIKKEAPAQVFSWEFSEIFKSTFFKEHIRATAFVLQLTNEKIK